MTRVLAVVAHPDDEVLGIGGTLLRHKAEGDEVHVLLTHKCRKLGIDEANEAGRRMGIRYAKAWVYDEVRGEPYDVERYVDWFKPDIVYTHSRADLHEDHQDVLHRTLVACRPQSGVRGLYSFETPSATDWSGVEFWPQAFVDITDTIEQKMHVMKAYESELREAPHPRNVLLLRDRASYWGQRAGVRYAEPLEVIRECW